ncbi:MAG: hypothetical protein ACRDMA_02345 [Solirubrobacterales bacterium]
MKEQLRRAGHGAGLHLRRQAVGYAALVVALGGSAYAGTKAGSGKVGGKDLRPFVERFGTEVTILPGRSGQSTAQCKRGERALAPLGVGSNQAADGAVMNTVVSAGLSKREGFLITALNPTSQPQTYQARVLCLKR